MLIGKKHLTVTMHWFITTITFIICSTVVLASAQISIDDLTCMNNTSFRVIITNQGDDPLKTKDINLSIVVEGLNPEYDAQHSKQYVAPLDKDYKLPIKGTWNTENIPAKEKVKKHHSYRKASTGCNREARYAGNKPAAIPISNANTRLPTISQRGNTGVKTE